MKSPDGTTSRRRSCGTSAVLSEPHALVEIQDRSRAVRALSSPVRMRYRPDRVRLVVLGVERVAWRANGGFVEPVRRAACAPAAVRRQADRCAQATAVHAGAPAYAIAARWRLFVTMPFRQLVERLLRVGELFGFDRALGSEQQHAGIGGRGLPQPQGRFAPRLRVLRRVGARDAPAPAPSPGRAGSLAIALERVSRLVARGISPQSG